MLLQEQVCLLRQPYRDITHFGKLSQLRTLHYIIVPLERPHTAPRPWFALTPFFPVFASKVRKGSATQHLHRNQYLFWRTPILQMQLPTPGLCRDFCPGLLPSGFRIANTCHASAHKRTYIPPAPILLCSYYFYSCIQDDGANITAYTLKEQATPA